MFIFHIVKRAFALKHIKGKIISITDSLDTIIDADHLLKHALAERNIGEYYLKISIDDSQDIPRKILSHVRHDNSPLCALDSFSNEFLRISKLMSIKAVVNR